MVCVHPAVSHSWTQLPLWVYESSFGIAVLCQRTSRVSPLDEDESGEHRVAKDEEEHF